MLTAPQSIVFADAAKTSDFNSALTTAKNTDGLTVNATKKTVEVASSAEAQKLIDAETKKLTDATSAQKTKNTQYTNTINDINSLDKTNFNTAVTNANNTDNLTVTKQSKTVDFTNKSAAQALIDAQTTKLNNASTKQKANNADYESKSEDPDYIFKNFNNPNYDKKHNHKLA